MGGLLSAVTSTEQRDALVLSSGQALRTAGPQAH